MAKKTKKRRPRRGLPRGAHRVRIEVVPRNEPDDWPWCVMKDRRLIVGTMTKVQAADEAVRLAREIVRQGGFASVRVHDRRGRLQSERTLPRSSDPFPP